MKKLILYLTIFILLLQLPFLNFGQNIINPDTKYDLKFASLASTWDEAIPLGNGMLGALVWQKGDNLRFSLDRADLWDLRPMTNLDNPEWKFEWVISQYKNNTYKKVQDAFDAPYDNNPAPSKIPAAALEFDIKKLGELNFVQLQISDATCIIGWKSGVELKTWVHATSPCGWFEFTNLKNELTPEIIPPAYNHEGKNDADSPVTGQDLRRLGYKKGMVTKSGNQITYIQEGWGGFKYKVHVSWHKKGSKLLGCWSISSEYQRWEKQNTATETVGNEILKGYKKSFREHSDWWNKFWKKSSVSIPDEVLARQWYMEQYKFGSVARNNAPPISLQGVWTADNGKLPPWKGDFHHDLNTQLSYWPAYSANHLDLEEGFMNWLWKYRDTFKKYTKSYFGVSGLNVPGVSTLTGEPMGGWIQYSFGPTVSAWLAQHFYLHWQYSADKIFLQEKAWPWIRDVAIFLDELSILDEKGKRKLPLSSSPEIYDNSRKAWFEENTNFDLAMIRWTFEKAAELANILNLKDEETKWRKVLTQWPDFNTDMNGGFVFAPGHPYESSHRHFSHLVGWHPLGIIDISNGDKDKKIIQSTIASLEKVGTDWWCGYSFSWMGNLYARANDGENAARILRIFSENFCLPNSFHVNGEQHNKGYSKFKYRPFTLEGNFAFASAIQEMLIQSHTGVIRLFPAIPEDWQNVSFKTLRTTGAFLVTAVKKDGKVSHIGILSEKGGKLKLENPFNPNSFKIKGAVCNSNSTNLIEIDTHPGQKITLSVEAQSQKK